MNSKNFIRNWLFGKRFLAFLLLLPCVCQAREYGGDYRLFVEQTGHHNYNFSLGASVGNMHREKGYYYSYDFMYFRVIEDKNTWRFSTSFPLVMVSFAGMISDMFRIGFHGANNIRPIGLFDPGWDWIPLVSTLPLMLMNPTVGLKTKTFGIGAGYNTDFFLFAKHPQIYFAPKIQLGIVIAQKILLSTVLSYQVVDCFAIKRGFHFGLSFASVNVPSASHPLKVYNKSNDNITVLLRSKTTGREIDLDDYYVWSILPHGRGVYYNKDSWETVVYRENGLIMQVFSDPVPPYYRKNETLLKEWDIPDWESVKKVKGEYYYP
jgi:hypothetical protein